MVLKESVDEAYFSEATVETNPLAKIIYDEMINSSETALVKELGDAQKEMFESDNKILFASETVASILKIGLFFSLTKLRIIRE